MSQTELENSHTKFKIYFKFLIYTTQLNFLPDFSWKVVNFLKLSIMPTLMFVSTAISTKEFINSIGKPHEIASFLFLIIMPCAWIQVLVKFFITAVFYKEKMQTFDKYFDGQVFNEDILTQMRQQTIPKNLNLAYQFGR